MLLSLVRKATKRVVKRACWLSAAKFHSEMCWSYTGDIIGVAHLHQY